MNAKILDYTLNFGPSIQVSAVTYVLRNVFMRNIFIVDFITLDIRLERGVARFSGCCDCSTLLCNLIQCILARL